MDMTRQVPRDLIHAFHLSTDDGMRKIEGAATVACLRSREVVSLKSVTGTGGSDASSPWCCLS